MHRKADGRGLYHLTSGQVFKSPNFINVPSGLSGQALSLQEPMVNICERPLCKTQNCTFSVKGLTSKKVLGSNLVDEWGLFV